MIILEHDHARQIVSVRVDPAHEHPVLLHEPEPRRRLARAGDDAFVAVSSRKVLDPLRPESRSVRPRRGREEDAHLVAIPLQRASMFSATRSPRRMLRALPRTVATCLTGWNVSPSSRCHSTLHTSLASEQQPTQIVEKEATHSHPTCVKTSVKNGLPARTAVWWPLPRRNASRCASPTTKPP